MTRKATKPPPKADTSLVENPNAPEVFADGAAGLFAHGGNIRITFESVRAVHAPQPTRNRVVVARVILPIAAAEVMARNLLEFIGKHGRKAMATERSADTLQ
jgi:hypothetical protein